MKVNLISYSMASKEFFDTDSSIRDIKGLVSYCARVSNPGNQMNEETSEKLLAYLIKHKHWSPFEMVNICLEIETTRDIAHQIVRHRSFSFQEFSQRYANPKSMGEFFVRRDARLQDKKNRQNSISLEDSDLEEKEQKTLEQQWLMQQDKVVLAAADAYNWAIDNGIAKEQARAVLPEGLTKTRLYMNGSLRSWIHYIDLRAANGTQLEHMKIAKECACVIAKIFPLIGDL